MPENEVGDRVHNFFDQGSLLQDQRHTQFVAANWTGYNNNIWNANERQVGTHVNTVPENYSSQQSDIERGQGNQFPLRPTGLNFARQNLRPECVRNPSQLSQPNLNGSMHTSQVGYTRHNVANFLGVDTEPDHHNMASKSPGLDSQQRSGSQFMNFANFGGLESPMIFNFFGGQHQMNGQQPGIMQSLPRQQPGYNDAQLQQHFVLKQLEQQRQHQLQQIEALQRSSAFFPHQTGGQHPLSMNGDLSRDGSNMNVQQRGLSASVQGHSNGFMITPEQGQALQYVGLIPQQTSQSLYGVPVSSSQSPNAYSLSNIDKPGMLQFSASSSSFSANQHGAFVEQASAKEGNVVSRYGSEGNKSSEQASTQPSGNNLGGFTQVQQRNVPMSEGGVQCFAGGSEFVMEKSVSQGFSQGASTQAAAGLDPTEEKILFGNDENIWEAFGGASLTGNEDATDLLSGFPSMQNGTWSALMQSAVAETSSTDGGTQEEWSGLGSKNSRQQSGSQHPSVSHCNEKSLHNLVESSPRASLSSHHSSNSMNIHNAMTKINIGNSSGQQHFLNQRRDINDAQQSSQPNSLKFIGFVPENGALVSNQDYLLEKGRGMQLRIDASDGAVTRFEPVPNSNIKLGSSHVSLKDGTLSPVSSNIKVNLESSQMLPNNHHLDLWKSVDAPGKSRYEDSGGDQHKLSKEPPILESSDNCPDGGSVGRHETENGDRRESSSDGHHTSFNPNASVGSSRGNMWSDSADRCSFPGGEEMPSGQAVKKGPVIRNLQYPVGNVDVNRDSYASKQVLHSQSMSQHFPAGVKGQEVNPRFLGAMSTDMTDMEGRVSDYQRPVHVSRVVSNGATTGCMPNISAASVRSGEVSTLNQHLSSSQNVLELLHKVDQSKEQNDAAHSCTPDYGRLFDTTSGGVAGPSQSHSSTSHGFNLQLAPPSQGIAPPTFSNAVQSSSRTMGSSSTGSGKGDKHAWLVSVSSAQCLPPSDQPTQMDSGTEPSRSGNMDGDAELKFKDNLSISSFRSPPQTEHSTAPGGRITGNQFSNMAVDRQGFRDQKLKDSQPQAVSSHPVSNSHGNLVVGREINAPSVQGQMRQMPASFPAVMAEMSRKDNLSHLRASRQLLGAQACNSAELLKSQFQLSNVPETSFTKQKENEQDVPKRVGALSSHGIVDGVETQLTDAQSSVKEASPSSHTITQKDIEPFHSLENQYNTLDNNSTMHQMQTMKNLGYDPSPRESKRLKSEDYVHDLKKSAGQRVIPFTSSMDSMAGDLSRQLGNQNTFQFQHGAVTSQDMLSFNDPKNYATGNVTCRTEHTGFNPQMAPSWFGQYGTFRNGQLPPVHNVSRMPMKNVEYQLISGNPPNNLNNSVPLYAAASEAGPVANTCQITTGYTPSDHVSSLHALVPHVSAPSPASMISKKLKTATSDLLSWNKEIGQCIKRLHNLSSAEVDWAHSSNRLIEKVEDDIENNDLLPLTRSRRRLLLTTHLMQQVLRPPSVGVLSLDASVDHEVIVYSLVRSVLGDACSLTCSVEGSSPVESAKLLSGKVETSEKIQDQDFSRVVKEFLSREEELENELLRLDKRASMLNFRLDCQDLERFSVINRFAQFHGRGQVDGAETSSSSDANTTVLKPCPQRYVTAHPMPRNVPEKVQCLSL